jgi:5'-3' exonuclease
MGVLKFQQWLRLKFSHHHSQNLHTLTQGATVGRFFIDFNAVIHNAINEVYETDDPDELERMYNMTAAYWTSSGGVLDLILTEIFDQINLVRPTRLVYIAADGPVMKAKLMQQRQRSYKSDTSQPFNRNQVKPGTDFMTTICSRVRQALKIWAKEGSESGEYRPAEIHLSDAFDEGEGEHKIMTLLNNKNSNPRGSQREVDVIYSPDSDVHFLSYIHANTKRTFIMRKLHEVTNENEPYEFFDATKIREEILRKYGFGNIQDFVLVCCFGGNDFIPALPFAKFGDGNVFDAITYTYVKVFGHRSSPALYSDNNIKWEALARYLSVLEIESRKFLEKAALNQIENIDRYYNAEANEDRRSAVLQWSLMGVDGDVEFNSTLFNERYKKYIFGTFHESDMIRESFNFDATQDQVANYLEGLAWVMSYYHTQGTNVNHDWCYTFHYPPDIIDIRKYLVLNHEDPIWTETPLNRTHQTLNTPLEHLVTILKREELWMLPQIVGTLFLQEMPDLFPEDVYVDKTGIPFGVEGKDVVLINFPSMSQIRSVFDLVRDDPSVLRINKVRKNPTKIWPSNRGGGKKNLFN